MAVRQIVYLQMEYLLTELILPNASSASLSSFVFVTVKKQLSDYRLNIIQVYILLLTFFSSDTVYKFYQAGFKQNHNTNLHNILW